MYYLSNITGYSYEQINIFVLYVIQPLVIILTTLMIYIKLIKGSCKADMIIYSIIMLIYSIAGFNFIKRILKSDWNSLAIEKINKIQDVAHSVGFNYADYNVIVFIIYFSINIILNILFYKYCKQLKVLSYTYWFIPGTLYLALYV